MKHQIYFPNLNGLRFIAASMVICYHTEYAKKIFGITNNFTTNLYGTYLGGLGVTLFFCLSGFLITYILLAEKQQKGSISIKNFYIRRVLRIWPLYFLVLFMAFFVLNQFDFFWIEELHQKANKQYYTLLLFYLLLIPNFIVFNSMPYATQCWSIGVEEQFYLLWPLIVSAVKRLDLFMYVTLGLLFFIYGFVDFLLPRIVTNETFNITRYLITNTRFECMLVGAIAAYTLVNQPNNSVINFIYRKDMQCCMYAATLLLVYFQPNCHGLGHIVYSIFFTLLILNLAGNKNTILSLENKPFDYLGKISYGLYMLHPVAVQITVKALDISQSNLHQNHPFVYNLVVYSAVFVLSIAMAGGSYTLFEKRFLNLKGKFSLITTGDRVKQC